MIGDIRGWAFGLLHLSRQDFYDMTQGEFWEALAAFREEAETNRKHVGELVRGLALRVVNLFVKKPYKSVEDFWPMPWDSRNDKAEDIAAELNQMSQEGRDALARKFLNTIESLKHGCTEDR